MDGGFRHIKVTPAEEQEVVIHAGAPAKDASAKPQADPVQAGAGPVGATRFQQAVQESGTMPKARRREQGAHRGTTLEDIESSKMPKTQVVIIVIAICAIIAFAVWYAFFS